MLQKFIARAMADEPVYISMVRQAFQSEGTRPFHCHAELYDHTTRVFRLKLPKCGGEREREFVASYVHAMLYNILSSLGAVKITIYIDPADKEAEALAGRLNEVFQLDLPKAARTGFGKCLNVNERTLAALCGADKRFCFELLPVSREPEVAEPLPVQAGESVFKKVTSAVSGRMLMGMDIGGTDVKLVAAVNGRLAVFKEFDWFPAGFSTAEQLIEPLLLLTRLMRAAASLFAAGRGAELNTAALDRHASPDAIERGVNEMEAAAGSAIRNFDAIGLCFPDVVIRNRVVGGETTKTAGMRANRSLDYEKQFAKITDLCSLLSKYVTPEGAVCNTNDGPMAAFTTAVEQAATRQELSGGFFAHTLGTELGTGWVRPDGSIPEIPLEVYNFIIDLGSFPQRQYDARDIRSINNLNTGLPGTLQKFACQSGVFRMAAKYMPENEPDILEAAFRKGLFVRENDALFVPTAPKDMRKPCLEYFMEQAAASDKSVSAEIFRRIGEALGVCWLETDYILRPETAERTLFGRLVKNQKCFEYICEGARRIVPNIKQYPANGELANTALMRQLEAHPDYTVAQFAQAVGAVYYGCMPFLNAKK